MLARSAFAPSRCVTLLDAVESAAIGLSCWRSWAPATIIRTQAVAQPAAGAGPVAPVPVVMRMLNSGLGLGP